MDRLKSARAVLRRLNKGDLENMRVLEADPLIMRFTPSRVPQSPEQTAARLESQISKQATLSPFGVWAAEAKAEAAFLGWFMLLPGEARYLELGFMLTQAVWGKGLATELCRTLVEFARTQPGLAGLVAHTNLDNAASIRVLSKLGFRETGRKSVPEKVLGGEVELRIFRLDF